MNGAVKRAHGPAGEISAQDREKQIGQVGSDLVRNYGKKVYYSVQEVKSANRRQDVRVEHVCWSHAAFNTKAEFDAFHRAIGQSCDF